MSVYKDCLCIGASEVGSRADLAVELIAAGTGCVVLEDLLVLRPKGEEIVCEVLARLATSSSHYEAAVVRARALLASSSIASVAAAKQLTWVVVEDYGMGTIELWRSS
jgi:hypothetical protein